MGRPFVATGSLADGSASYQLITLTPIPDESRLGLVEIHHTGDTTPATVTAKVTRDVTGDQCMFGPAVCGLEAGVTSGSKSGNFSLSDLPIARGSAGVAGALHLWVKYDAVGAGPTVVSVRVHGEQMP